MMLYVPAMRDEALQRVSRQVSGDVQRPVYGSRPGSAEVIRYTAAFAKKVAIICRIVEWGLVRKYRPGARCHVCSTIKTALINP